MEHSKSRCPQLRYEYNIYKILTEDTEEKKKLTGIPKDLFLYCNRKFSLKTTLMLADQCIKRIQIVHDKCFIHRDIKPDNFVMGINQTSNVVYVIDFDHAFVGTVRYASINNHKGIEQSRRDDLEALGYMNQRKKQEKYAKILEKKEQIPINELCSELDIEFVTYINECRNMKYDEEPNYLELRKLFWKMAKNNNIDFDGDFDWIQLERKRRQTKSNTKEH
ncbi:non-specific serine/threonine protein kinase [Entamoeba marina]